MMALLYVRFSGKVFKESYFGIQLGIECVTVCPVHVELVFPGHMASVVLRASVFRTAVVYHVAGFVVHVFACFHIVEMDRVDWRHVTGIYEWVGVCSSVITVGQVGYLMCTGCVKSSLEPLGRAEVHVGSSG